MRRQRIILQAFFAFAVVWFAASVPARGTSLDVGNSIGGMHGDTVAVSVPHATIGGATASRKSPPSDWSSRGFLLSRTTAARVVFASASAVPGRAFIRHSASLTFTYDATAPPAILNTVR